MTNHKSLGQGSFRDMPGLYTMKFRFQGTEGDLRAWLMKHRPGVEANQTGRQPPRVSVSFRTFRCDC